MHWHFVFIQIGYASFVGAAVQPWACCSDSPDLSVRTASTNGPARVLSHRIAYIFLQIQADLYTALYAAVWSQPFISGIFPWAWSAGDYLPGGSTVPSGGARCSTNFDIVGKPAQVRPPPSLHTTQASALHPLMPLS